MKQKKEEAKEKGVIQTDIRSMKKVLLHDFATTLYIRFLKMPI
jgi:hypothetical protein